MSSPAVVVEMAVVAIEPGIAVEAIVPIEIQSDATLSVVIDVETSASIISG